MLCRRSLVERWNFGAGWSTTSAGGSRLGLSLSLYRSRSRRIDSVDGLDWSPSGGTTRYLTWSMCQSSTRPSSSDIQSLCWLRTLVIYPGNYEWPFAWFLTQTVWAVNSFRCWDCGSWPSSCLFLTLSDISGYRRSRWEAHEKLSRCDIRSGIMR